MRGFIDQRMERYCELSGVKEKTQGVVATPALDDGSFAPEQRGAMGTLAPHPLKIQDVARAYRRGML